MVTFSYLFGRFIGAGFMCGLIPIIVACVRRQGGAVFPIVLACGFFGMLHPWIGLGAAAVMTVIVLALGPGEESGSKEKLYPMAELDKNVPESVLDFCKKNLGDRPKLETYLQECVNRSVLEEKYVKSLLLLFAPNRGPAAAEEREVPMQDGGFQQYAPQPPVQQYAPQPPVQQQYAPQTPVQQQYAPQSPVQQYAPQPQMQQRSSALICLRSGAMAGKTFRVGAGTRVLAGRDTARCQMVLSGYGRVSGVHCSIEVGDRCLRVMDMNSTNGTFVNDKRLAPNQPALLRAGDTLKLGDETCVLLVDFE